jgi:hypothetical protein
MKSGYGVLASVLGNFVPCAKAVKKKSGKLVVVRKWDALYALN